MMDAEPSPPARRRRPRERGQGQRGKRVNLRLSDPEHATLEAVAARHGTTLAGYVSAAALSAARDEMPPDLREMMVRLFAMQHDVVALRTAPDRQPDDVDQAILAMREALENTIEEVINLSRKARGMRALRTLSRLQPAPATPQPAATAVPRPPSNARASGSSSSPSSPASWRTAAPPSHSSTGTTAACTTHSSTPSSPSDTHTPEASTS